MNGYWRVLPGEHLQPVPPAASVTAGGSVDTLTEAAFQESARADAKSAALLTIVGIGFTAFAAGCASAAVVPLRGPAQWLSVGALAGVCAVAELLLLALRPRVGDGGIGERYFAVWRRYEDAADVLAAELSAEPDACRTLIQLSRIVWRKYMLIRWAVNLLMAVIPVIAVAVSVALLLRLPLTVRADPRDGRPSGHHGTTRSVAKAVGHVGCAQQPQCQPGEPAPSAAPSIAIKLA